VLAAWASVPLPQVGRAYRITLVVEDDCTISRSVAELSAANVALTRPQATVPAAVTFDTSYEYHVNARVWDCCGIVMTQLVTDLYWTSSGSTISWWNYGGFTSHHRENYTCTPPGSGWYATGPRYTVQDSGGVGYSTVAVRDHAEFGYKGAFSDCIDGLYYNVLENWVYGASLGEGDCGFYGSFRQTAPGWHVVVDCYYPYRTIVDQRY